MMELFTTTSKLTRARRGARIRTAGLILGVLAVSAFAGATSALASVTEFTSQSAFDAAAPTATQFSFDAGGAVSVAPNPFSTNGLSFLDVATAPDAVNGGEPILFLIDATDTPTYGRDFLSFQNTDVGDFAQIDSPGVTAIGFDYGTYIAPGPATVTLSTGESFVIAPSTTAAFVGFTSTTPITRVSIDFPTGYSFDLLDVSSVSGAPEPGTWALMLFGVAAIGAALRRRPRASDATLAA